jgi:signal transduction histidine kinase
LNRDISARILTNLPPSISESEVKRLRLTVYLCITSMAVSLIYTTLDLANGIYFALPFYSVIFIAPIISLWLIKIGKFLIGKILVLMGASVAIFFASISDPFETGVILIFVPLSIVPFAIIGFRNIWASIGIVLSTFFLFLTSRFTDFFSSYVKEVPVSYIQMSLALNYLISVTISILIIYFLARLHRKSEVRLIEKEKAVTEKNIELTKLNQELDGFVYSVSHDLRSPLSSILGLTNLAKFSNSKEELVEYMAMIQDRIKTQDAFIKDIIEYSRNTRTEPLTEPVDLFQLTQEIIESLKFNLGADKIHFDIELPKDFIVTTDKNRWKTMLSNLIGNAIKYHDPTKPNQYIKLSANRSSEKLLYTVTDNGSGISSQHLDKIFNMFYRASDTSSGSGLGLFITKEAVQKLNGTIAVTSQQHVGSVFEITIPILNRG